MNKPTPPAPYNIKYFPSTSLDGYASWEKVITAKEQIMKEIGDRLNPRIVLHCSQYTIHIRGEYDEPRPSYPEELKNYHTELHKYLAYLKEQEREAHEALSQSS